MCEKISVRKNNSRMMCVSSDRRLKLNQWTRLYFNDFVFSEDGTESQLISKEEIQNCYKGYYNETGEVFLPTEKMSNEEVKAILVDLCDTNIRCYIGSDRPLEDDQIYLCDQNNDLAIFMNIEDLSEGYDVYDFANMYVGEVSGNMLRVIMQITEDICYKIKNIY